MPPKANVKPISKSKPVKKDNPDSVEEWESAVTGLPNKPHPAALTIEDPDYISGSKLTKADFLHFRILWRPLLPVNEFEILDFVAKKHMRFAKAVINNQKDKMWYNFHSSASRKETIFSASELGPFAFVKSLQTYITHQMDETYDTSRETEKVCMTLRSESARKAENEQDITQGMSELRITSIETPQRPQPVYDTGFSKPYPLTPRSVVPFNARAEDEEIVSMALCGLLTTVTLCVEKLQGALQWLPIRKPFSVGNNICEARTDGILRRKGASSSHTSPTLAIIEVKAYARGGHKMEIQWQEGCQMAAWISTALNSNNLQERQAGLLRSPKNVMRRLLVSQDHGEIFLTIGEYTRAYEDYLFKEARPPTPEAQDDSPLKKRQLHTSPNTEAIKGSKARPRPAELEDQDFLIMRSFGPFATYTPRHVKFFCSCIIALMLELAESEGL